MREHQHLKEAGGFSEKEILSFEKEQELNITRQAVAQNDLNQLTIIFEHQRAMGWGSHFIQEAFLTCITNQNVALVKALLQRGVLLDTPVESIGFSLREWASHTVDFLKRQSQLQQISPTTIEKAQEIVQLIALASGETKE